MMKGSSSRTAITSKGLYYGSDSLLWHSDWIFFKGIFSYPSYYIFKHDFDIILGTAQLNENNYSSCPGEQLPPHKGAKLGSK